MESTQYLLDKAKAYDKIIKLNALPLILFAFTLQLKCTAETKINSLILPGQVFSKPADGETGISYRVYIPEIFGAKSPASSLPIAFSASGNTKNITGK